MKNKRDQLNNAFHNLRDDTMAEALAAMEQPSVSRSVRTRRWMTAAAACFALMLAVGAMIAVPMMTAEDLTLPVTDPATSPTTPTTDDTPEEEPFYVSASLVRLDQLSANETVIVSDPDIPAEKLNVQVDQTMVFENYHVLHFDCLPGETVTIRSRTNCLGYVEMKYDPNADLDERCAFSNACRMLRHHSSPTLSSDQPFWDCVSELTFDPSVSSVVIYIQYTKPADCVDEDVLLYTISNEEGQITGAGGMYVGQKYFRLTDMPGASRRIPAVMRAASLDSVRFTNPASVTEEQVEALLESFAEKGKDGRNMVDFTPMTMEENLDAAIYEIRDTVLADVKTSGGSRFIGFYTDYAFYGVDLSDSEMTRQFIIFKDGSWAELYCEHDGPVTYRYSHSNAECPLTEQHGEHGIADGCTVQTTDGRLYHLEEYDVDNIERTYTAILIYDPAA